MRRYPFASTHLQPSRSLHSKHKLLIKIIFHLFLFFFFFVIKVDPTEEKGAPHPFLPSRGDLCLLFSTQAPELLVLLLFECTPLPFLCPSQRWKVGRTEAEVGLCAFGGGRGSGKVHLAVCVVYILELLLASAASCLGLAAGIDKLLLRVGRDELHPSCQPHRVRQSRLVCYRL